jgi:hypothetical protein
LQEPGRHSLFESAGYREHSTSIESPQPLFNMNHAQENPLLEYNDRQPSEYNGLTDIPAQNIVHPNVNYTSRFVYEAPIRNLEYPPIKNSSPRITHGSFSSPKSENHCKKALRTSQASIHYMLPCLRY